MKPGPGPSRVAPSRRQRAVVAALRRARLAARPTRAAAVLRSWLRRTELGLLVLAVIAGAASGAVAAFMGGATGWLHVRLFGAEAEHGLSALSEVQLFLLLLPAVGGLALGILNIGLTK